MIEDKSTGLLAFAEASSQTPQVARIRTDFPQNASKLDSILSDLFNGALWAWGTHNVPKVQRSSIKIPPVFRPK